MRLISPIKNLTREQLEKRFDEAACEFLRSRDAEWRSELIELHDRLRELDGEKKPRVQTPVLQFRDHRLMKRKSGYVVWPPVWVKMGQKKSISLTGEIGYLNRVLTNEVSDKSLYLVITHQGSSYIGAMAFDDAIFCLQLSEFLKSKIGLSIKEIGDLDISCLL